jgi:carbon monoxide dehydrogenase subunit G
MIEINETFEVGAGPDQVFAVLADPSVVVSCIAGAELGDQLPDGDYLGSMSVRFSAVRVAFAGRVRLELDHAARTGTVTARGKDGTNSTRFAATAKFAVEPAVSQGCSRVVVSGHVDLVGRLVSMIEGAAAGVVRRMTQEFVAALTLRCAGPPEPSAEPSESAGVAPQAGHLKEAGWSSALSPIRFLIGWTRRVLARFAPAVSRSLFRREGKENDVLNPE